MKYNKPVILVCHLPRFWHRQESSVELWLPSEGRAPASDWPKKLPDADLSSVTRLASAQKVLASLMTMPKEASNGLPTRAHTEAVQKLLDAALEDVDGAAALATEAGCAADDASAAGVEAERLQRCTFNAK